MKHLEIVAEILGGREVFGNPSEEQLDEWQLVPLFLRELEGDGYISIFNEHIERRTGCDYVDKVVIETLSSKQLEEIRTAFDDGTA